MADFLLRFAKRLPPDAHVADLGSGPGRDTQWLQGWGVNAIAVDRSSEMLRIAASRGVPVAQADLRRPPFADGSLDGIWSIASLLHVPADETEPTLQRWHDILRPGGYLGLCTSLGDEEGWEKVPYAATGIRPEQLNRWFVHRPKAALLETITKVGFRLEEQEIRTSHRTWIQLIARRTR